MSELKGETQVASLTGVIYDKETDDVFVKFRVLDDEYKSLVLRAAKRDDIEFSVRGENLVISPVSKTEDE